MKFLSLVAAGCFAVALAIGGSVVRADARTIVNPDAFTIKHIVVFGDSLSDQGNTEFAFGFPPLRLYPNGRYSDGLNWIDLLSGQLGPVVAPSLQHGTNYSWAFGTTGPQNSPPPLPFSPQNLSQQEQIYLNHVHGKADPNTLYIIEGGATDILGLLFAAQTNPLEILFIPTLDLTAAQNIANETQALLNAGAQRVLVPNVPNLGLLPIVTETSGLNGLIAPTVATTAAQLYDSDLANDVLPMTSGGKVILWDFYNTSAIVIKKAKQFGVTNTTTECVLGYGTVPTAKNKCTPTQEAGHAFYDQVHFTTIGYLGMEQGAMCALGFSNALGVGKSQCVVTQQSVQAGRSARYIPPSTFNELYRENVQHRGQVPH